MNLVTQSLGLLILAVLSFMFGFNTSYKHDHVHLFIDFLIKCYAWVLNWIWRGVDQMIHYLQGHHILLFQYDEKVTQIFAGFVLLYSIGLIIETIYKAFVKNLLLRSIKRS
ncbi:MAG: hypothetical protein KDD40_00265 [Bdellovibrionales bacterium]|nr:hypothetical protein [Bdellovibrionales bacterium]